MTGTDSEFPVKIKGDKNKVGILGSVVHWLLDLKRKENSEMEKKRKIEINMKNV